MTEYWTDIHRDFSKKPYSYLSNKTYKQIWEEQNLTYQDAQEWIAIGFKPKDDWKVIQWKNHDFTPQQAKSWRKAGLKPFFLDLGRDRWFNYAEFASYLRYKDHQPNKDLNLEKLKEEFEVWKKENKPAQEYLDIAFPKNQRERTTRLYLYDIDKKTSKGS